MGSTQGSSVMRKAKEADFWKGWHRRVTLSPTYHPPPAKDAHILIPRTCHFLWQRRIKVADGIKVTHQLKMREMNLDYLEHGEVGIIRVHVGSCLPMSGQTKRSLWLLWSDVETERKLCVWSVLAAFDSASPPWHCWHLGPVILCCSVYCRMWRRPLASTVSQILRFFNVKIFTFITQLLEPPASILCPSSVPAPLLTHAVGHMERKKGHFLF